MRIVCESCGETAEAHVRVEADGLPRVVCAGCGAVQSLGAGEGPPAERAAASAPPGEIGWDGVLARWADEDVHRAYLSRCRDLDELAQVGQRYREALESRPGDPVARRWRDEVVKRASALALAQMPRTDRPRAAPRWARALLAGAVVLLAAVVGVMLLRIFTLLKRPLVP